MKNNLGVTRWLVAPRAVVVQTGLILLLLGVVVGQNVERVWHLFKASGGPDAGQAQPQGAQAAALGAAPVAGPALAPTAALPAGALPDFTAAPARREPPLVARLTDTERWITTSSPDQRKRGYSVLAVLRPGGELVIERCRAPEAGSQASCEVVLDQVIAVIGETRIDLGNGRSFNYSLVRRDGVELLHLSLAEELELVPGTKTSLVKRLRDQNDEAPIRGRWARTSARQSVARN